MRTGTIPDANVTEARHIPSRAAIDHRTRIPGKTPKGHKTVMNTHTYSLLRLTALFRLLSLGTVWSGNLESLTERYRPESLKNHFGQSVSFPIQNDRQPRRLRSRVPQVLGADRAARLTTRETRRWRKRSAHATGRGGLGKRPERPEPGPWHSARGIRQTNGPSVPLPGECARPERHGVRGLRIAPVSIHLFRKRWAPPTGHPGGRRHSARDEPSR